MRNIRKVLSIAGVVALGMLSGAGGARAGDADCRVVAARAVTMRHANLALNTQYRHDWLAARAASGAAREKKVAKLKDETLQMVAFGEEQKRYMASVPQCLDAVLDRLRADEAANPDVDGEWIAELSRRR